MFSVATRDRVRERLLGHAEADPEIVGAALTGSHALGDVDRWSDIDLVLAVRDDPGGPLDRWTGWLYDEFGARHHWDLPADGRAVRVFLLPDWLEIDLTFARNAEFGARGPQWRTVFGRPRTLEPFGGPDPRTVIGLGWHHALHAHVCLARGRWWQAEHWISALRDHVIALSCLRLGHPTGHAKGAHLLPDAVTGPLEATLVRAVTAPELRRALAATVGVWADELDRTEPELAGTLRPMLAQLTDSGPAETGAAGAAASDAEPADGETAAEAAAAQADAAADAVGVADPGPAHRGPTGSGSTRGGGRATAGGQPAGGGRPAGGGGRR